MIGQNRWPVVVLAIALFTSSWWLPRIGITSAFRAPTADEAQATGWQDPATTEHIARDVFDRVNRERVARGAPALVWHDGLAELAREWSLHMVVDGTYGHSPDEFRAHPDFVGTGENIAMGQSGAAEVHVGWMRSDGHRENILRTAFDAMGIGIVCRNDGTMSATQIFGVADGASTQRPPVDIAVDPIVAGDRGPVCPVIRHPFG